MSFRIVLIKFPLVVRFQHKYFPQLAIFFGLIAPTLIAATWGDALGGFLYAGVIGRILVWHSTFCINRLVSTH
jgi:stearoyl-CoA desaturase (Delta-9 desaturase)